ncbi:MAG: iron-containing redox enzyme family protein, partial [Acidimicrobiales bacterium]
LSREELTSYAEQYRHFEAMLPSFLRQLSDELESGAARDLVLANLSDEVSARSHLELFDDFGAFVGAADVAPSPAMSDLLAAYGEVAQRGAVSSLAGLLAYESQGAAVADSKGAGLAAHYGAPDEALAFWREHSSIEDEHADWTFDALSSLDPDLDEVYASARLVGEAWWAFLDERESLAA